MKNINKVFKRKPVVFVVCGPTATGKSNRAVEIALGLKHGGEVVSADSRQVYRGMDLGSGKITQKEMRGVPHHLLDIADPRNTNTSTEMYNVSQYKKDAERVIEDIITRGKTPIICGGTGYYIDALLYNTNFPEVRPNETLRKVLAKKTLNELQVILQGKDFERFESVDIQNKVRLIRAIEIIESLGKVPTVKRTLRKDWTIQIEYIDKDDDVLKNRIAKRVHARIEEGMIEEVERLHAEGVSYERLEQFGLEYKYIALYLQEKISRNEMTEQLIIAINQYAKRQRTWFKKHLPK